MPHLEESTAFSPRLTRLFSSKHIYIRSSSQTRCLTLSPLSQIGFMSLGAVLLAWGVYASTSYVMRTTDARSLENQLASLRQAYETQLDTMLGKQKALESALQQKTRLSERVTTQLNEKQRLLIASAENMNDMRRENTALRTKIAHLRTIRDAARDKIADLGRIIAQNGFAAEAIQPINPAMKRSLHALSASIDTVIQERDHALSTRENLERRLSVLTSQVKQYRDYQEQVLSQIEKAARSALPALNDIFKSADLDVPRILKLAARDFSGQGGPFEPVDGLDEQATASDEDMRISALMSDLEQINLMRTAMDRLPFGRPVDGARLTSPFGIRRDPFRHRRSHHDGVDLAAPMGTPIHVTANGIVTFNGRMRGYGNVIKVRHAFGFETVYAHLSRSLVKVGERVERGETIAKMGSTGRSTGSHLHYEVRIDNKPVNPKKFIEAAKNVL